MEKQLDVNVEERVKRAQAYFKAGHNIVLHFEFFKHQFLDSVVSIVWQDLHYVLLHIQT